MPQAWITATRRDVLARLGAAIAAAAADTPLHGMHLPANRWTRYKPDQLPGMFVRVGRLRRQGFGNTAPQFDLAADIELHAAVSALELDAAQLDDRIEAIFDQVDLVLLEDPDFLRHNQIASVEAADIEFDDAEGSEHYVRVGVVTYTVLVQQIFEPRIPDALRRAAVMAPFAPVSGGPAGDRHAVKAAIDLPQE